MPQSESLELPPAHDPAVPMGGGRERKDDASLLELAIVLAKHKKLLIGLPLAVAVASTALSYQLTPLYTATTTVLPPQQQQSAAAAMLGQIGGALVGAGAGSALGIKNPADVYLGMLKSRTIADRLIERFELMKRAGHERMSDARLALSTASVINADKNGLININVDDPDPKIAAALANAYVEELTKLTSGLAITETSQRRLFLERQLFDARGNLLQAERSAKDALNKGGISMVDEQGKSMVETIAALRAQVTAKEVQIASMKSFATDQNPEFVKARNELAALRQQMDRMESGSGVQRDAHKSNEQDQGLRNVALMRDVKYQQFLYELLTKQYEMAKLDEAREGVIVQVIDKAIEPDRKSKPQRKQIVVLSTLAAAFAAVLLAFFRESMDRAAQSHDASERWKRLRRYLAWR